VLMLVVFILLAVRGVRWWPAVTVGALALIVTVDLLTVMAPIGRDAVLSARMGLWFLIYATLLAGVMERWLAGERPVSEARRWRERV